MTATPIRPRCGASWARVSPDLSCEVCFDQLDAYVDAEVLGQDADALGLGMRAHLAGCPACADVHDSLKALASDE